MKTFSQTSLRFLGAAFFSLCTFSNYCLADVAPPANFTNGNDQHTKGKASVGTQIIYTGIKAVDLFAPIPLGGDILISGEQKSGARILGTEIAYRIVNQQGQSSRVIVYLDSATEDLEAFSQELQEGIPAVKEVYKVPTVTANDIRLHGWTSPSPGGVAIFAISKNESFVSAFRRATTEARKTVNTSSPLTTFVVTEVISPEGFDAKLISSRALASEGIYPALDVRVSSSVASSSPMISSRQRKLAESLRESLGGVVAEMRTGALNDPSWSFNADSSKLSPVQALRFMSQPYFIAEPYTGLKSAFVPVEVTVSNFEAIAAGQLAQAPSKSLTMQNALVPELATAAVAR